MTRETFLLVTLARLPHLDGEGKVTIERTAIHRLIKQSFDAGAESAANSRVEHEASDDLSGFEPFRSIFNPKK
jgi:hypothetical protein